MMFEKQYRTPLLFNMTTASETYMDIPDLSIGIKKELNLFSSQKRPFENGTDSEDIKVSQPKRMKLKEVPVNIGEKNPVALLNELRPGLEYRIIQRAGPVHAPVFTMSVKVDNQDYEGRGTTKKKAKAKAAENALRSFIQLPNSTEMNSPVIKLNIDFTEDVSTDNAGGNIQKVGVPLLPVTKLKPTDLSKGPVMLLNEMFPGLKYDCMLIKGDVFGNFKTTVEIKGEIYVGTGSSKKNSKNAAAKAALAKILSIPSCSPAMVVPLPSVKPPFPNCSMPQEIADCIGSLMEINFSCGKTLKWNLYKESARITTSVW